MLSSCHRISHLMADHNILRFNLLSFLAKFGSIGGFLVHGLCGAPLSSPPAQFVASRIVISPYDSSSGPIFRILYSFLFAVGPA